MKANEAPENIYLLPNEKNPNGLSICLYEAPYRTGAIEYIRADAFIKKAVVWISNNCYIPHSTLEDFEKYIKGE